MPENSSLNGIEGLLPRKDPKIQGDIAAAATSYHLTPEMTPGAQLGLAFFRMFCALIGVSLAASFVYLVPLNPQHGAEGAASNANSGYRTFTCKPSLPIAIPSQEGRDWLEFATSDAQHLGKDALLGDEPRAYMGRDEFGRYKVFYPRGWKEERIFRQYLRPRRE
ncbi:hypothetical protein KEM54_003749 [Ascosphaera aggregata]|nr:hypothetical protein KEM54_003749 [Ascosphaera aggregata]